MPESPPPPRPDSGATHVRPGRLRRLLFSAIMVVLSLILIEALSAIGVYYFQVVDSRPFTARHSAALYAVEVLLDETGSKPRPEMILTPHAFVEPDPTVGYRSIPGRYRFEIVLEDQSLAFEATVDPDGSRRTSYRRVEADYRLLIFGDSYVWGFGNPDQSVFAWLLQDRYADAVRVRNFALPGFGTINEMLQISTMADDLGPRDLVIVGYADYYVERDVATPHWVRSTDQNRTVDNPGPDITYATVDDGQLTVRSRPPLCRDNDDWCERAEPHLEEGMPVTIAIMDRIVSTVSASGAGLVVAYLKGSDDDLVVGHLRELGVPVADLRPDPDGFEYDNFEPLDFHPGPLGHFHYADKLAAFLESTNLVPWRDAGSAPDDGRVETE